MRWLWTTRTKWSRSSIRDTLPSGVLRVTRLNWLYKTSCTGVLASAFLDTRRDINEPSVTIPLIVLNMPIFPVNWNTKSNNTIEFIKQIYEQITIWSFLLIIFNIELWLNH